MSESCDGSITFSDMFSLCASSVSNLWITESVVLTFSVEEFTWFSAEGYDSIDPYSTIKNKYFYNKNKWYF